ncbi:MAG TPA: hydroxyisourate hydrolase [Candidatus Sulfopaludibacter sp.]|jgi:5-hydroxyisourate hydrolase|nr:hydroxyisourate hydrolase [Candidatus Sulfopaludibacter sp.]
MARLSTHVLDTSRGKPAADLQVRLYREGELVASAATNQDGRTAEPLLSGDSIPTGMYELVFAVGAYFGSSDFLDEVVVRFRVADGSANYHVPLLVSPFGYTTYRGS